MPAMQPFYMDAASAPDLRHRPTGLPGVISGKHGSLDFLDPTHGLFYYKWALYSAGLIGLGSDAAAAKKKPAIIDRSQDPTRFIFVDSGGYQVASETLGVPLDSPEKMETFRRNSLKWMIEHADVGMPLDFPMAIKRKSGGSLDFDTALGSTVESLEFIRRERPTSGGPIILNVIQGKDWDQQDTWYKKVRSYSLDGWSMPWRAHGSVHSLLQRLVAMVHDKALRNSQILHLFGLSRLHFAGALTLLMRAMRQHDDVRDDFIITYDTKLPMVLAAQAAQAYTPWQIEKREENSKNVAKFNFSHVTPPCDISNINSTDPFPVLSSPIGMGLTVGDLCVRTPANNNGSTWDIISCALVAAHNTYSHIMAIQQLNLLMDLELKRAEQDSANKVLLPLTHEFSQFREFVNRIFANGVSRDQALRTIYSNRELLQFFDRQDTVQIQALKAGALPDWSSADLEEFPEESEVPMMHAE
ncbi:hypothetical protein [Azospirillum himalayense]|uniref:DUF1073 domain-containing protein n=1 Tax=Azospirillum himalayense TaxID=654847 RepID=A0ABW0G1V2_9PROT